MTLLRRGVNKCLFTLDREVKVKDMVPLSQA